MKRVTGVLYDVPCFIETEQVQIFMEQFANYSITEQHIDGKDVAVTSYRPHANINLYLDPDFAGHELGTTGIWKSEMRDAILVGNGVTANLGGPVTSDPWVTMIDDHGEILEEDRQPTVRGFWTQEHEDSFQSVVSSNQEKIQIRDLKTGQDRTLSRAEVIIKFREDRYNNDLGFRILNPE